MDAELRRLQRLSQADPTEENIRRFRKAAVRQGYNKLTDIGWRRGELVSVTEVDRGNGIWITVPWVGRIEKFLAKTKTGGKIYLVRFIAFHNSEEAINQANVWSTYDLFNVLEDEIRILDVVNEARK